MLQGLLQPLVGLVVEGLAVDGQRADVVHDLAAEVVLACASEISIFSSMERISRSSGSSSWPVYLFRTRSRCVYAFTLSM
jgi:hypothetical protein